MSIPQVKFLNWLRNPFCVFRWCTDRFLLQNYRVRHLTLMGVLPEADLDHLVGPGRLGWCLRDNYRFWWSDAPWFRYTRYVYRWQWFTEFIMYYSALNLAKMYAPCRTTLIGVVRKWTGLGRDFSCKPSSSLYSQTSADWLLLGRVVNGCFGYTTISMGVSSVVECNAVQYL